MSDVTAHSGDPSHHEDRDVPIRDGGSETTADDDKHALPASPGTLWPVSICFWCTLLLAATLYASVALAPKLAVWNQIRHEYQQNASQLAKLEQDVDYLERVRDALETDPEFVRRLAGLANPAAANDGSEMIPVSGNLLFGYDDSDPTASAGLAVTEPPFNVQIMTLARHRRLRTGLLCAAALLIMFGFTFLNDAGTRLVASAGRAVRMVATLPMRRYTQPMHVDAGQTKADNCETDTESAS